MENKKKKTKKAKLNDLKKASGGFYLGIDLESDGSGVEKPKDHDNLGR